MSDLKTFMHFGRKCKNNANAPEPNLGTLVLFFGRRTRRFARMAEIFLMMIMMVSMIIMMIILVILMIIMTKMTKKHTITVKFE